MAFSISGGGPDMGYWLGVKYAQLQQHADATTAQANAAVQEANARAQNIQALTPGQVALQTAQQKQMGAQTGQIGAQTNSINTLLPAQLRNLTAQADLTGAQAKFYPGIAQSQIAASRAATQGQKIQNYLSGYMADPTAPLIGRSQIDELLGPL